MYVGVLLLYGNLLTLGFSVFAMVMLHLQILQEERYLESAFGTIYTEYKKGFSLSWQKIIVRMRMGKKEVKED